MLVIATVCCFGAYAQITFNFKAEDVAMWKKFMQHPSAIEGKCNLEAVGIDPKQDGFDWDNPNTWKRTKDGKVFHDGATASFATTVWGVSFSHNENLQGGTMRVGWTRRAYIEGTTEVFEKGKDAEEKYIPYTPGIENLTGTFELTTMGNVVTCCDTKIEKIRVVMNNEAKDNYLSFSRNPSLIQIDLSDSKGKIRQMPSYRNNLSTLDAFVLENMRPDDDGYKLFDWMTNIDDNHFRLSTMPLVRDRLINGYKKQKPFVPESYKLSSDGETWEFKAGLFINLSPEATVRNQPTTFVWKTADGEIVTPDKEQSGRFQFKESFIGKELICEMTNSFFDGWICKTQPVTIVAEYTGGVGIKNLEAKPSVAVFPNPAENKVTITGVSVSEVNIFTLQGVRVMNNPVYDNTVDVSSLSKGNYLIQIITENGLVTKKLLKK